MWQAMSYMKSWHELKGTLMKHVHIYSVILMLLAIPGVAHADKPQQDEKGFVSLFNAKDLSGWVVMGKKEGWKVQDDMIHSDSRTGGAWLRSEKKYGEFVFKVDWKVSQGGNSGVFIRSTEKGYPWKTGYEVQISNAPRDDSHASDGYIEYRNIRIKQIE